MDFASICSWGSIFMWLISIFSRIQPKISTNQALKGKIYGRPNIYSVNSLHDNTEPTFSSKRQWVRRRPSQIAHWERGGAVKKCSALMRRPRPPKTCTKSPPMKLHYSELYWLPDCGSKHSSEVPNRQHCRRCSLALCFEKFLRDTFVSRGLSFCCVQSDLKS